MGLQNAAEMRGRHWNQTAADLPGGEPPEPLLPVRGIAAAGKVVAASRGEARGPRKPRGGDGLGKLLSRLRRVYVEVGG